MYLIAIGIILLVVHEPVVDLLMPTDIYLQICTQTYKCTIFYNVLFGSYVLICAKSAD